MELCRVNVDERRNVVDEERDLAEPRASVYDEMPVMIIKTECDGENAITTEELQEGLTQLSGHFVTDISLLVKEEHDFVTKIEHETGEATVKRELDIGPTVLQSQSALAPLVLPLSTRAFSSDLRFGTSSADGGAAAPLCTTSLRLAAGTGVEDDHCERIDGGPSRDGCGGGPRTADGPRREVVEEVGAPGRCGSRSPKECDCGKDGCKAYTCTSGEVFYCDYCNYDTMRRCDLLQHIRTHKCKKPYTCEYCDFKTPYSSILKQHALIHTGVKPYACVRCDFKTSYSSYMKKHVLIHTGEKPYTCVLCEYSVNRKDRLQTHMRIHMGGKPYECEQCTYRTFHMGNFKRHIRTHRGKRFLTLKPHSYSPFQVRYSKMHMPTHPRVKPFRYELCEFSGSELDSREPVLTHMGGESSNCEQFEGNTSLLSELKVQTTTHICAKLYECELCEYSASTLGNSENHIDSHREEKQQGCEQSECAARPNGDLKTYTHTRQSPHKCEQEEEFGISLSNLKKDTHSHTAESPVECEQREYSASPRGHVKAPLRTYERKRRIE